MAAPAAAAAAGGGGGGAAAGGVTKGATAPGAGGGEGPQQPQKPQPDAQPDLDDVQGSGQDDEEEGGQPSLLAPLAPPDGSNLALKLGAGVVLAAVLITGGLMLLPQLLVGGLLGGGTDQ